MRRTQGDDIVVRTAGPDDAPGLDAMLRLLTPTSAFMRFLVGFGEPKPGLVRALLATGPQRGALLAVLPGGTAVGHACWSVDDAGAVDVGVVVVDGWQRMGVGRRLVGTSLGHARDVGAVTLHLDVHPMNRGLLATLRRRLPTARHALADGLVSIDVRLADLFSAAVSPVSPAVSAPAEDAAVRAGGTPPRRSARTDGRASR
ncbi:GNAT family N-acetyltransferase [Kineosporia sp. R_H_3]|uniref:GNAT family N-acetyltransferase n=1 Tax=Kineosporia sp. R_H_3 TaxID=1961848 RepID=UPI000B4B8FAC|nr:GNAT family N-acetyltransferase [Kineosporia sp. R_H_3]